MLLSYRPGDECYRLCKDVSNPDQSRNLLLQHRRRLGEIRVHHSRRRVHRRRFGPSGRSTKLKLRSDVATSPIAIPRGFHGGGAVRAGGYRGARSRLADTGVGAVAVRGGRFGYGYRWAGAAAVGATAVGAAAPGLIEIPRFQLYGRCEGRAHRRGFGTFGGRLCRDPKLQRPPYGWDNPDWRPGESGRFRRAVTPLDGPQLNAASSTAGPSRSHCFQRRFAEVILCIAFVAVDIS
ncbi:hypothetical protein ACVWVY_004724 [Bradyrhizobium sp. URHC0002]